MRCSAMQFRAISRLHRERERVLRIRSSPSSPSSSSSSSLSSLMIELSFAILERRARLLGARMARQKFPSGIRQLGAHALPGVRSLGPPCRFPSLPSPLPVSSFCLALFPPSEKTRDKITPRYPLVPTLFRAPLRARSLVRSRGVRACID